MVRIFFFLHYNSMMHSLCNFYSFELNTIFVFVSFTSERCTTTYGTFTHSINSFFPSSPLYFKLSITGFWCIKSAYHGNMCVCVLCSFVFVFFLFHILLMIIQSFSALCVFFVCSSDSF